MIRKTLCERIQREIYGGFASDDAEITLPLINSYVNTAIALAVKQNYVENLKMDGVAYVNSSFYTTFKNLTITKSDIDYSCFAVTLPEIPVALGHNEGVAQVIITDGAFFSFEAIPLTIEQASYRRNMRPIPNKIFYWNERDSLILDSSKSLTDYKAIVKIASGGSDVTDLTAPIYLPQEWIAFVQEYVVKNLIFERQQVPDLVNDGVDKP